MRQPLFYVPGVGIRRGFSIFVEHNMFRDPL